MTHVFAARTVPEKRKPKRSIPCRGRDLFGAVNAALPSPRSCCEDWLPGGRANGEEYSVLNPTRSDRRVGSFKINLKTARWADFATDAKGGDLISLYAYLHGLRQIEAAQELADKFGVMS